ncbi:MAG: hypothetical protein LBR53_05235, partial [Deltaproteobacteria bacterium]|nr:hypothetical protein [Deltaproteobacteria bacterium]
MTDDRTREEGRNQTDADNAETADNAIGGSAGVQSPRKQKAAHNRLAKDHVLKRVLAYIFPYLFGLKELFANSRKLQVLLDDDFAVAP